jgi:hypothetical protein
MKHKIIKESSNTSPSSTATELGQNIVVLDRGFVYVGSVVEYPDRIRISEAKNIRRWGTTKGIGELVAGPTKDTVLDPVREVIVYRHAVIHLIPCRGF